jgi:hypothetical protein
MKHQSLLMDERACKALSQSEQDQIMTDLIQYLKALDSQHYSFHGKNEYGYQMSISEHCGYGFSIDICWNHNELWCYRNYGYVHPNLVTVSGELRNKLVSELREIAIKWSCGIK